MGKLEKGDNSVMDKVNLQKVYQVIYMMDTTCEPNIMILAQVVLEIFCSQAGTDLQWESGKREIIKSWIE